MARLHDEINKIVAGGVDGETPLEHALKVSEDGGRFIFCDNKHVHIDVRAQSESEAWSRLSELLATRQTDWELETVLVENRMENEQAVQDVRDSLDDLRQFFKDHLAPQ